MARAHTTTLIIDTEDYFSAHLDNGGVRFGIKGSDLPMWDIPASHARYAEIVAADLAELENIYDEFFGAELLRH